MLLNLKRKHLIKRGFELGAYSSIVMTSLICEYTCHEHLHSNETNSL